MSEPFVPLLREAYSRELTHALERGQTLVFASQIAADFWRRHLVTAGAAVALREDRFVSWDRFKENAFDLRTDALPANESIRTLFSANLLRENASAPFLDALVPRAYASQSEPFVARISRILRSVPRAADLASFRASHAWLDRILSDLRQIDERYRAFLNDHDLYEPAWLARAPAFLGGDWFLAFPELATDYDEFAAAIASVPRLTVPDEPLPVLEIHRDTQLELESVFARIAALLDEGNPPEEIVLTVGDLPRLRPRLVELSSLSAVPLSFRQGTTLAESSIGRFIRALIEADATGYSMDTMKRLVLSRAVPWAHPDDHPRAVERAVRFGLLGGERDTRDGWARIAAEMPSVLAMNRACQSVALASSARDLRTSVLAFLGSALDQDGWDPENERVLQRCMQELRDLADLESRLGTNVPNPAQFWLSRLDATMYVPKGGERGVPVLPYRVGAGIPPAYHFVVNAHAGSIAVRETRYPFLSNSEREQLGDSIADRDMTELFVRAYAVSGEQVVVSSASRSWDGPQLPPSPFVAAGATAPAEHSGTPLERWRTEEEQEFAVSGTIYGLQSRGATEYVRMSGRKGPDLTVSPIERDGLADAAAAALVYEAQPDLIRLSSSALHQFIACRFGFLLSNVLGVEELELEINPDDPRRLGTLYHDLLNTFYQGLREDDSTVDPSRASEYESAFSSLLHQAQSRRHGMVPRLGIAALEERMLRAFRTVIDHDADLIAGHHIRSSEKRDEVEADLLGAALVGRLDRVSVDPKGQLTVVDYKRNELPKKVAQKGGSADAIGLRDMEESARVADRDAISSYQIPFYVLLLELSGYGVGSAAYYSLEGGNADIVFDDAGESRTIMSRARMDEVIDHLRSRIAGLVSDVRSGTYSCQDNCDGCAFRGICRNRFVVQ